MYKKGLVVLLGGCMLVSLVACSKTTTQGDNSATEQEVVSDTATEAENISAEEETVSADAQEEPNAQEQEEVSDQIALIKENKDTWNRADSEGEQYNYTVSDLDHDGYLEITTASMQGTGLYTYFTIYEVNEDKTGLVEQSYDAEEGESLPDIIETTVDTYTMADGTVNYAYTDILRAGPADSYEIIGYLTLGDGKLTITPVATKYEMFETEEESTTTYADAEDKEITEDDYNAAMKNTFTGATKGTQKFLWISEEDWNDDITDQLTSAYETFTGNN
ncbi:hypothetical protein [Eubacterium oxidoreducens]|uniref:Uncharacterized protein n=1 Tax=Eubacterium oxidoreducens TaxID=1732 RepID=A0A1G6AWT8_EUBOX|nr:hypothetical protein [Eubacterium oxidoreducens]SDB12887.1 hypothetical protein SAMN02910417_00984 [Eubacterium oxidoreducens]